MTDVELSWIAGFLEGEGYFRAQPRKSKLERTRKSPELQVTAAQVQREPLDRLVRYTGIGRVHGPYSYPTKNPNKAPLHDWSVAGEPAAILMRMLRPFMSPKRSAEIDAALASWEARPPRDHGLIMKKVWAKRRLKMANDSAQIRLVQ